MSVATLADQGHPRIKSNAWIARNKRIVSKSYVFGRVGDDHQISLRYGVGEEGNFTRGLVCIQSDDGLEPLAMGINKSNSGNRNTADISSQAGDVVVGIFSISILHVVLTESGKPCGFV